MRRLVALALLSACAHRGGLRYPGPLVGMGEQPPAYAEVVAQAPAAEPEPAPRDRSSRRHKQGAKVARAAQGFIGDRRLTVDGQRFRYDCSGLVMAAYAGAGLPVSGSSRDLYAMARERGVLHKRHRPSPGDVAFFDNTYDRNHNGRRDDELSHVAIVEDVDDDGTITLIHKGSHGVVRIYMNLDHAHQATDAEGDRLNSYLRASRDKDKGGVLTGELWRGFGSLWRVAAPAVATCPTAQPASTRPVTG